MPDLNAFPVGGVGMIAGDVLRRRPQRRSRPHPRDEEEGGQEEQIREYGRNHGQGREGTEVGGG